MMSLRKTLILLLIAAAPSVHAQTLAPGRLLVATPEMQDPEFAESVLLILIHDNGSTAAIFLNRPTWVDPEVAYPDIAALANYGDALFLGGPVAPDQILTLFEQPGPPPETARNLFGNVYFSPTTDPLESLDPTAEIAPRIRVFAGHVQWVQGQLERQIANGNWRVLVAGEEQVFADDPASLWALMPSGDGVTASLY